MKILEKITRRIIDMSSVHYSHLLKNIKIFAFVIGKKRVVVDIGSGMSPYRKFFNFDEFLRIDLDDRVRPDVVGDICHLPIRIEAVETVVCVEVLEHIMNVDKALRELHYVLKKGGVLILTVPLLFGVHAQADFFRWTEAGIRLIIEKAGFHVLVIKKNGGIFSTIGETLRHIPDQIFSMPQKFQVGYIVAFIMYLLLIPFSKLFIILDSWDLKKNFTTGYSILAVK